MQAPLFWGGDISVRVTATLRLGGFALVVPVHVANVQVSWLPFSLFSLDYISRQRLCSTCPMARGQRTGQLLPLLSFYLII